MYAKKKNTGSNFMLPMLCLLNFKGTDRLKVKIWGKIFHVSETETEHEEL